MRISAGLLAFSCAIMAAGCTDDGEGGNDAGPTTPPCTSRVDGKLGGEDCRCAEDSECAAGYACAQHFCVQVACEEDDDCEEGQVCIISTGACSEPICQTAADCRPGQACVGGSCAEAPDPASVANCVVHGPTVTRQGQNANLGVTAYTTGGAVVSQMSYVWMVTEGNTSVSAAAAGVLTGGDVDGDWTVSAAVADVDGNALSVSCSHSGRNFATVAAATLRVLVLDQRTGLPIAGARVVTVIAGQEISGDTELNGQASFGELSGSVDSVSVFFDTDALEADYFTVIEPGTDLAAGSGNDLAVYLFTREKGKKAGVEGSFDFSKLPDRQLKLGLAGASLPGSLADIDFGVLIGDSVMTQVDIAGLPLPEEGVPLPQGITLKFGLSTFKDRFQALTYAGRRTVWGLGGTFRLSAITQLLPVIAPLIEDTEGGLPIGQLLGAVMPLFAQMKHAAAVGVDVTSVTCNPGNLANGDPVDCIEAFGGHFVERTLSFASGLDFRTSFAMPSLPPKGEGFLSAVLGLIGVNMPSQGLVPLGIGIGVDDLDTSDTTPGDGQISGMNGARDGSITVNYARSHSGLDGNGILGLFLALDFDGLLGGGGGDTAISGIVVQDDYFVTCADEATCPQQATRSSFLGLPTGASWNSLTRAYSAPGAVDGADYYRFGLEGQGGKWTFYHAAGASITVPAVPTGMPDRAKNATVQAFDLSGDATLAGVLAFNDRNMDAINDVTSAFSSIDCIGGGAGCALTECDAENACAEGSSCVDGACQ